MKRFDIQHINGTSIRKEVGVYAESGEHLQALYSSLGQEIKILKEYEDDAPTKAPANLDPSILNYFDQDVLDSSSLPNLPENRQECERSRKYFKLDNTPFMLMDGVLYTQKWQDYDGDDIRIVSSKGNAVKMDNRKIQTLEWVKVDEDE